MLSVSAVSGTVCSDNDFSRSLHSHKFSLHLVAYWVAAARKVEYVAA